MLEEGKNFFFNQGKTSALGEREFVLVTSQSFHMGLLGTDCAWAAPISRRWTNVAAKVA